MRCKKCGWDNEEGSLICVRCNAPIDEPESPNKFKPLECPTIYGSPEMYWRNSDFKQRNGCITVWLWLAIIMNFVIAIMCAVLMTKGDGWETIIAGILSMVGINNILGSILLLKWKKNGFTLLIISAIVNAIIFSPKGLILYALGSLFSIIIWWAILQVKKNGVSAWSQLSRDWNFRNCRQIYITFSIVIIILLIVSTTFAVKNAQKIEQREILLAENCLQIIITIENYNNPQEIKEGLTIEYIYIDGDYVMLQCKYDEEIFDKQQIKETKEERRNNFRKTIRNSEQLLDYCIRAHKSIGWNYQGDKTGDTTIILIPYSEVQSF